MKIGYACINETLSCRSSRTFRLKSYSEQLIKEKISSNLSCLLEILQWNLHHHIYFFRISSDLIPFASHPVCAFPWQMEFKKQFREIGAFISAHAMRVAMHPDQFVLLNAKDPEIVRKSIAELKYHAEVLDLLGCDESAKIQIHTGGVYNDKPVAIKRFCDAYNTLPDSITRRLVIENDERLYSLQDVMGIHTQTLVPVLLDVFHHTLFNNNEPLDTALRQAAATWTKRDGLPIVDFSTQKPESRIGSHAVSLDRGEFSRFLKESRGFDFDVMLEIKNKEKSALAAIALAKKESRLYTGHPQK
ncbi:MAG: UV DNA damage repair endonuclease UvsE [Spirochaetales bacterium]|nr:UV DNA damage repair endonuclease UvsE [Spirochaetales bacterium]